MNRIAKLTLFVVGCVLAAVACFSLTGCEVPLTTEETAQVGELDQKIDLATADLSALEDRAKEQAKLLVDADPANDAAAISEIEAVHARYVEIGAALQADLAARGKILDEATQRATGPVTGGLATAFPQWAPIILLGGSLASRLLAQRSREHLLDSFQALGRANVGDFIGGLLRSLGYAHSNNDPVKVLEGAEAAAIKRGDYEEAARIRTLAVSLAAEREMKRAPAQVAIPAAS